MRGVRLVLLGFVVLGATACGASKSDQPKRVIMPNVVGQSLDIAESNLQTAGIDPSKIAIAGGGTFGIVVKSNWHVCSQTPAAGAVASSTPRISVQRTCASSAAGQQTTVPTTTSTATPPSTPSTVIEGVSASTMEQTYLTHLANNSVPSIKSMCDSQFTRWSCFYDGVSDGAGYLRVNLTTDGGWTDSDLDAMAKDAGIAWFNFIGCDYPKLSMIVVNINGLDHNVARADTHADWMC